MTAPTPQAQVTEEMVERGAKALYAKGLRSEPWEITYEIYRILHRNDARIVLESTLSAPPARQDVEVGLMERKVFEAAMAWGGNENRSKDDDMEELLAKAIRDCRAAQALARVRGEKE